MTGDPIQHVIVLMLENRSFDHLLGCMKSLHPKLVGFDPAKPGLNKEGLTWYPQTPDAKFLLPYGVDPKHELSDVQEQVAFNGAAGGYVHNFIRNYPDKKSSAPQVMSYFDRKGKTRLPVLHTLAESFTICDRWFSSVPGPTWPNRFFVHSGTSNGWIYMPAGLFSHWHNYNQPTLYRRLKEKNVTWRIYHDGIPQSLMLTELRQPSYATNFSDIKYFWEDTKQSETKFPQYVFIEPNYFGGYENDQHPPANMMEGEVLMAKIYNALRANDALWQKTLLVILYDEHGGFYDQVVPPAATPPDPLAGDGFKFDRYGPRVPALLVSPYAPQNILSTSFDHTSLLRYLSDKWGLGPLGSRTAAAKSFASVLLSTPRADTPANIPQPSTQLSATLKLAARQPARTQAPPPINDLQATLLAFTQVLDAEIDEPAAHKARRLRLSVQSPEDHIAVAEERVKKFLAQQKRRAKTQRR